MGAPNGKANRLRRTGQPLVLDNVLDALDIFQGKPEDHPPLAYPCQSRASLLASFWRLHIGGKCMTLGYHCQLLFSVHGLCKSNLGLG